MIFEVNFCQTLNRFLEHPTARMAFTRALLLRFAADSLPKDDKKSTGIVMKLMMDEILFGTEMIPREGTFLSNPEKSG